MTANSMENSDYLVRLQHPDPIVRARVLDALADQHYDEYVAGPRGQDYRDWLVERLKLPMSGMTLGRYLRLLETPAAVQLAISNREIPRTLAYRVALLHAGLQHEIAERVEAGEPAKQVVEDVVQRSCKSSVPAPGTAAGEYRKLLTTAGRTLRVVSGHEQEIASQALPSDAAVEILDRLSAFVSAMKHAEIEARERSIGAIRSRMIEN